ncbi:MAG: transporter substrate-binding domain-containing protein [Flexilinea flocculi]|nr:transporter substrate-binding domain-containing protein [Flexilinea flocculi]
MNHVIKSALKKELIIGFFLLCLLSVFSPVTAADSHLSAVKSNGVLYFGTSSDYVPFTFYGADGTITGLDIQLAEEIANRIGVSLRVIDLAYDGLIDSVRVGQVDLIGGALSKSIENAQLVDFSRVYFMGTGRIVALKSKEIPADITLSFLSDKSIGVQGGTNFEQWVLANLVTEDRAAEQFLVRYLTIADAVKGLDQEEVDFVLMDLNTYDRYYKSSGNYQLILEDQIKEEFAFASHQDSSLIPEVNRQLNFMMVDGTAQRIAEDFFSNVYPISNSRRIRQSMPDSSGSSVQSEIPCTNAMQFIGDVTIPDGSKINRGASFTKIWRIYNLGSCTWNMNYRLVPYNTVNSDHMSYQISRTVPPYSVYDFPVIMTAPSEIGDYQSSWQLQTSEGKNFGQTIWVKINVVEPEMDQSPEESSDLTAVPQ